MSQTKTEAAVLTAQKLAGMNGDQIVKMGRELISQLGSGSGAHGNIWPGNIRFDEDGKAILGPGSTAPMKRRTPDEIEYMAPEAFWKSDFSRQSDLYSIAMVMYTAYNNGNLPFSEGSESSDAQRAQALRRRMRGEKLPMPAAASEAVAAILEQALSYETEGRYADCGQMMHDLGETDEALPAMAPEDSGEGPETADAAAAAATGMAGISAVSEMQDMDKTGVRPVEAAEGFSANRIVTEHEVENLGKTPDEGETRKHRSGGKRFARATAAPKMQVEDLPVAEETVTEEPAAPKKEYHVDTEIDQKAMRKVQGRRMGGAIAAVVIGVLVIAGMVAVACYSLGLIGGAPEETETSEETVTTTEETATTPEPTAEPTETPEPTEAPATYEAYPCDWDWDELENLAVITNEAELKNAIAAAEEAGLKNAWLGARWLDADDAPEGESGWYWLDDSPLAADDERWGEGEPSVEEGGRLMLSYDSIAEVWHFRAVTAEDFAAGGTERFPDMGYIVRAGSEFTKATPSPRPSPAASLTPAPDYVAPVVEEETTPTPTQAPVPVPVPTAEPTPVPTAEPVPEPTETPEATEEPVPEPTETPEPAEEPTVEPTPEPTETPEPTPVPTETPEKYRVEQTEDVWYLLETEEDEDYLATAETEEKQEIVIRLLDEYNEKHGDAPLDTVWLGAQYLTEENAPEGEAGWYWLDGSALEAEEEDWAENQPPEDCSGRKLVLVYDGEQEAWKLAAFSMEGLGEETAEALETLYAKTKPEKD